MVVNKLRRLSFGRYEDVDKMREIAGCFGCGDRRLELRKGSAQDCSTKE